MKPKIALLIIPVLVGILYVIVRTENDDQQAYEQRYFERLHLMLTGVIHDVKVTNTNDCGILYIDVLNTNISAYDPRDSAHNYYCVIKDKKAEILQDGIRQFQAGDSISLNTDTRMLRDYRNGKLNFEDPLNLLFHAQPFIVKFHRL